jgi:hypothetical protein
MVKQDSELSEAAAGFDRELAAYTRLGELFIDAPVASVKQLERANTTLGEITACEERLQAAGQRLVQALAAARTQQEQLARDVIARVPVVRGRNEQLKQLMTELAAVAGDVGELNTAIAGHNNGEPTNLASAGAARDISTMLIALSERAAKLATTARDAEFEELAAQAHALHQRLQAIGKKLHKAAGG